MQERDLQPTSPEAAEALFTEVMGGKLHAEDLEAFEQAAQVWGLKLESVNPSEKDGKTDQRVVINLIKEGSNSPESHIQNPKLTINPRSGKYEGYQAAGHYQEPDPGAAKLSAVLTRPYAGFSGLFIGTNEKGDTSICLTKEVLHRNVVGHEEAITSEQTAYLQDAVPHPLSQELEDAIGELLGAFRVMYDKDGLANLKARPEPDSAGLE